ncbi:hypothetical protein [Streptomyces sp. NPDC127100]|uniref:hypothetical protein n=1 Tax=Streptomyces sp. NPDC127100 TaxID=3347138 RepID=UPI0036588995
MTHASTASAPRAAVPGDARVLAARPLRAEARLEETSRYGDDLWLLTPAWLRADRKAHQLDFALVPPAHRETAKLLFYALLIEDTPPGEGPITIASIRVYFTCVRRFLVWAQDRRLSLAQLTGEDLDAYHRELTGLRMSLSGVYRQRRAVRLLWAYRSRLTDLLVQDPLRRPLWQAWARANPRRYDENLTDRIPEHIMGPLLVWALRWVDDLADDVLAARAERDDIDARPPAHPDPLVALQAVLDDFRRRGQPLPTAPDRLAKGLQGTEVSPNFSYLARLAGHPQYRFSKAGPRRLIEEAARDLGVDSDSPLHHRVQGQIDGRRWLEQISYYDVGQFERLLQVSCWIVIAYLSGLRDSEIKHLRRGCVSAQRDTGGGIYRYRLHGLAFKGEGVHGAAATWIVTAPVARAVAVLERCQPADEPYLFAHPRKSANHQCHHVAGRVRTGGTTIRDITAILKWINTYCAAQSRVDAIPETDGRLPHLTLRQFRRTLAWFIARRPGGTIAGALQYRHQCIQMFEGYAGTSDSGFRDEVEAEEAFARGQFLAELGADDARPKLTGPAGAEAEARLAELARHTVFDGQVVTDEARLRRILARHDTHLYPGAFVTCAYNPDRALCRTPADRADQPTMADCQPLACRNAALTTANRQALAGHLTRLDDTLAAGDRLAPYIRHRLEEQHHATSTFLTRHTPETAE